LTRFGLATAVFLVLLPGAIGFLRRHQIAFLAGRLFGTTQIRLVARRAAMRFVSSLASLHQEIDVQKGTVKWFNPTKGYGFIQPSTGDKDVFVHISAVERAGLSSLNEGQTVEYELVSNRGKSSAENLKVA
jgi:cold shock protein